MQACAGLHGLTSPSTWRPRAVSKPILLGVFKGVRIFTMIAVKFRPAKLRQLSRLSAQTRIQFSVGSAQKSSLSA